MIMVCGFVDDDDDDDDDGQRMTIPHTTSQARTVLKLCDRLHHLAAQSRTKFDRIPLSNR